ncbi:response regulator [Pseudoxanthomonas sp. PXM02]|uniref:response regulator n=1 Tax=Pseudoxanthomonas sp. PXM02 TaxID=2769294 RepID=UPI001782D525|nr:response regulator [Pseudoxanthomonas sp. PXM02]MBD9480056.1 response regulator [Pseudoxanthomonas sp. PXM02]
MTKVLLVEDEPDLLAMVSEALTHHGVDVIEAESGLRAIERLRTDGPFDLLVSDIAMPGDVSGIDVANAVVDAYPHMRVVLTSGHPLSHFPPLPQNVRFLPKPYRVKQLMEIVRTLAP